MGERDARCNRIGILRAEALQANEIYPQIWDDVDDAADYLTSYYETVRDYYLDAAAKGNAMLKYTN
jgi:hypothetical protein